MSTQQQVMKSFMYYLDNTKEAGITALNEAVKYCSGGKYTSMQQIINEFVSAANSYNAYTDSAAKSFLLKYCGINLDNTDTGSIIGADAGGSTIYTPSSIVPETGSLLNVARSRTSYTIDGVTFTWSSSLTDTEAAIVNRLCTWWAKGAMDLVYKAYGIKYTETDSMGKSIKINFTHAGLGSYAAQAGASWSGYVGGPYTANLSININMDYYDYIDINDPNGDAKVQIGYTIYSGGMLDRVLAHEVTHSIMQAVIEPSCMKSLPQFIKEGLAELVHGIDDERTSDILYLAKNPYTLNNALNTSDTGTGSIYCYSGGYMLLRYMAQQIAGNTGTGTVPSIVWSNANTNVKINSTYTSSSFDGTKYSSLRNIDAAAFTKALTIKGNSNANIIKASAGGSTINAGKGNDTIYAGAGTDTIQYAKDGGYDIIYNLSSTDKIKFVSDSLKSIAAASTGNDVVITTTNGGKMTLKAATGKNLNVINSAGTTTKYVVGRNDANNSFTWASGVRYIGTGKTDTLNVNSAGGTVDLTNTTLYKSINAVNASKATKAVTLKGGAQAVNITGSKYNDTIKAGSKGGTINGGKGNDIITAGAGVDTIVIADGMGTDTITGFTASDKIKVTSASYSLSASGSDIIVTAGTGKAVIKSGFGKNIQVVDNNGTTTKYKVGKKDTANTFTWTSGINYAGSSKTDTVNINTGGANADLSKSASIEKINANKATKAVTIKGGAYITTITGSAYADKITAGSKGGTIRAGKGNDTIYAGAGTDTIQYAKGEGSDIIYNLSSTDKIKFVSDSLKNIAVTSTGNDVIINTTNGGKMTLKAATGKVINVVNSAGTTVKYALGRKDADNTYTWASGARFVGTAKKDTINLKTGGATIDLTNTTLYKSIDAVSASSASSAVTIKGGAQAVNITGSKYNDTIKAGSKGGTLIGGKGNDKIYAGAGADIIKFAAGDGNDTVYNYNNSQDIIRLTSGSVANYKVVNGNGVITTTNGTVTLNGYTSSSVYVTGSDGVKKKYTVSTAPVIKNGMTWNSSNTSVKLYNSYAKSCFDGLLTYTDVITIDASSMTKELDIDGNKKNNVIKASAGGSWIDGWDGNDTIYLGAGHDCVTWWSNEGNDTVYNFNPNYDKLFIREDINSSYITGKFRYSVSGNDIVIRNSKYNSTLTLKSANTSSVKNYLSGLGISASGTYYNYQSSLGCIASSISDTSVPSVMCYTEYQSLAGISDRTLATGSSELSALQKKYAQY